MRRLKAPLVLTSLVALVWSGCPTREVAAIDPSQRREEYKDIPVVVNRNVDILFVIDNSGSMQHEQQSLAQNFFRFVNVLETIEGGLPNIHLGVVSTNMGVGPYNIDQCQNGGDNGRLQNVARITGCNPPQGFFIEDVEIPNCQDPNPDNCRQRNYTDSLAETFSCIAQLGINGCGFEQQLEAMKAALDGRNPEPAGILRDKAYLAAIPITDEDDCSAQDPRIFDPSQNSLNSELGPLHSYRCFEFGMYCDGGPIGRTVGTSFQSCEPRGDSFLHHPQDYVDFLKGLKDDPSQVIVAAITGPPTPVEIIEYGEAVDLAYSCDVAATARAYPSVRMSYFMDQFPNRSRVTSICNTDLSEALSQVAELLAEVVGNPCLSGAVDTTDLYPDKTGLQVDCQVSYVRYPRTEREEETVLPRCEMADETTPASNTPVPCWYVYKDTDACAATPTNLVIQVHDSSEPPLGTHVIARCVAD